MEPSYYLHPDLDSVMAASCMDIKELGITILKLDKAKCLMARKKELQLRGATFDTKPP